MGFGETHDVEHLVVVHPVAGFDILGRLAIRAGGNTRGADPLDEIGLESGAVDLDGLLGVLRQQLLGQLGLGIAVVEPSARERFA